MIGKVKWVVCQPLIGGMAIGFENAFGSLPLAIITCGFNNDEHYIKYINETRNLNIPIIKMDSTYTEFIDTASEVLFNEIIVDGLDVLMHVAVCSGLSQLNCSRTGSKRMGWADNDQNQNMYNLSKLGMNLGANIVAFENAPAAYTKVGEETIKRLIEISNTYNYTTQLFRTNTLLHGIPQSRKRTFIMFYKNGNPGLFNYEYKKYTILTDYLNEVNKTMMHFNDYVDIETKDVFYDFVLHESGMSTFHDAIIKLGPDKNICTSLTLTNYIGFEIGIKYFKDKLEQTQDVKYEKAIRLSKHCKKKLSLGLGFWDGSTCLQNGGMYINALIAKNMQKLLHPSKERGYNIREMLHLMGHPHNFEMIDPKKNWWQISQNVPVPAAEFVGSQIKEYLNGNLKISSTTFVKQDNIKQKLDTLSYSIEEEW